MLPFDYVKPKDHAEASALLEAGAGQARALLGGTDLIVRARAGSIRLARVVDLKGLPGLREIRAAGDGGLVIGAGCTMNQVAQHPAVQRDYGVLAQACSSVASYQLRNRATIGGNCCNASPAADSAPALYCLDALAEIYGPDGVRYLPIAEFFVAPGRSALKPGEFLTALLLPPAARGSAGAFAKLGRTRAGDIATVNVAVCAWHDGAGDGAHGEDALRTSRAGRAAAQRWRIALGAVAPTPLYAGQAAAMLAAGQAADEAVRAAADLAAAAARPIDDVRAGAAYRKAMIRVLVRRAIEDVLACQARAALDGAAQEAEATGQPVWAAANASSRARLRGAA